MLALQFEKIEVLQQVRGIQLTAEQGFALALAEISQLKQQNAAAAAREEKMFALLMEMNDRVMSLQVMHPQLGTTQAVQVALQTSTLTAAVPASEAAAQLDSVVAWVAGFDQCGPLERGMAANLQGHYDEAADHAGDAWFQEKQRSESRSWFLIRAALLEANALVQANRREEASEALLEAVALLDAQTQPLLRAHVLQQARSILREAGHYGEAEQALREALALLVQHLGPASVPVVQAANDLGMVLNQEACHQEAEPLFRWAISFIESREGESSIRLSSFLNNLAALLFATNRYAKAGPMYRRALAIDEKSYGPEHPEVATELLNLAGLLHELARSGEALSLIQRAVGIFQCNGEQQGYVHPALATAQSWLEDIQRAVGSGGGEDAETRGSIQQS